jgi:hypothetical protein
MNFRQEEIFHDKPTKNTLHHRACPCLPAGRCSARRNGFYEQ